MVNGYRITDIGKIPCDWEIKKLRDCTKKNLTYGINAPSVNYDSKLPQYIRITDITDDGYYNETNRVSVDNEDADRYVVHEGDILLARTGASTGKSYLYRVEDGRLVYAGFLISASIDRDKADERFIFAQLHTERYWKWVESTSQRSGQPGINGKEYGEYLLAFPKKAEQTSIANAISDIENLIFTQEALIAKKQAIKQGAMQELLTGKRRLAGFVDKWTIKKLKYIAPLQRGFDLPLATLMEGKVPVVFSNGINAYHNEAMVKGPGVITGRSGTIGSIHYVEEDYWPHNTSLWVTSFCGNYPKYIFYLFHTIRWEKYMSGSGVPTLNRNDVHECEVNLPTDINEQKTIAQVLEEIDEDIATQQAKLEKLRRIKSGMMDKLLTGKIRLTD